LMEQDMNSAQQSASQSISQGLLQDADEQDGDVPSEEYNTPDSQQTSNSYGLRRNRVAQDYRWGPCVSVSALTRGLKLRD
jgi:hypothetical protein